MAQAAQSHSLPSPNSDLQSRCTQLSASQTKSPSLQFLQAIHGLLQRSVDAHRNVQEAQQMAGLRKQDDQHGRELASILVK